MLDEMDRLRTSNHLFQLLSHYVQLGKEDRQIWHDRLLDFDGIHGRELARLYGELIAHGWLEQNTGPPECGKLKDSQLASLSMPGRVTDQSRSTLRS